MLKFFDLKPEAFGLDFSDLSLKFAKLKKKGKFLSLASWGEISIKPGIIEQGEIKDEETLVKIIQHGLDKVKGERLKTKYVVASLPEKKAFFRVIQMPKMEKDELKTAIQFEAENYIPLPVEDAYLDFQIVPAVYDHLDHLDVLIAAVSRKTTDSYVSCLKKAGLYPQVLEVESQSIVKALIKNGVSPFPVFIVDFGRSRASFIIFSGYSMRFTSSVPISSQKLTEAISRVLKKDLTEAEKLKLKYGLQISQKTQLKKKKRDVASGKSLEGKKVSEAMIPVLTDLVEQIKRYIEYYQTYAGHEHLLSKNKEIEKIILCGRGANLKGLTDFLSFELKIPTELGNPWINVLPEPLKEVPELTFKESLGYTTALGLALRGMKK